MNNLLEWMHQSWRNRFVKGLHSVETIFINEKDQLRVFKNNAWYLGYGLNINEPGQIEVCEFDNRLGYTVESHFHILGHEGCKISKFGLGLVSEVNYYTEDDYSSSESLVGAVIDGVLYGEINSILPDNQTIIKDFNLLAIYPNPFNSEITIKYHLNKHTSLNIEIFDLRGYLIEELVKEKQIPGVYSISWIPINVSSGIYFVYIKTDAMIEVNKVVYLK